MLEIINLRKTFNPGTVNEKTALDGVSLTLRDGDFVSVIAETARANPRCSMPSRAPGWWIRAPFPSTG